MKLRLAYANYVILFCICSLISCKQKTTAHFDATAQLAEAPKEYFIIERGVNISHFLSQTDRNDAERKNFFNEKDIEQIASLGYDHIRLPIDEKNMWDEEGKKDELAFQSLHKVLNWSQKNNLRVIVDLHIVRSHYFNESYNPLWDEVEEKEKFKDLWRQLSFELKNYSIDNIGYEILNEPVANNPDDWNKLLAQTIEVIRKEEPKRKIVVGSNRWNSVNTFGDLKIPENDENLILSFHFYSPHVFTHYKAPWSKKVGFYKGPVHYPGKPILEEDLEGYTEVQKISLLEDNAEYSKEYMESKMAQAIAVAKEHGLQLYCGEFGSYPSTLEKDRLLWYRDMISIFEANNIAWANWDYKGGFGVVNSRNEPNEELVNALLNKNTSIGTEKSKKTE